MNDSYLLASLQSYLNWQTKLQILEMGFQSIRGFGALLLQKSEAFEAIFAEAILQLWRRWFEVDYEEDDGKKIVENMM